MNDFQTRLRQHGAPVSVGLILLWVAAFLAVWLTQGRMFNILSFETSRAAAEPWTFLTYPLAFPPTSNGFISLIFLVFWFWNIGARAEREMGTNRFLAFCVAFTLAASVLMLVGSMLLSTGGILYSGWLLAAAATVIWGTRYPNEQAMFMLILPLQAKWLALVSVGLVFFGTQPPLLALFAALPLLLVHFFAADRLPIRYAKGASAPAARYKMDSKRDKRYFEEVKRREKEREERERLRKLFESSLSDEDERNR